MAFTSHFNQPANIAPGLADSEREGDNKDLIYLMRRSMTVDASAAQRVFIGASLALVALSVLLGVSNSLRGEDAWIIQNFGRAQAVIQAMIPALVIGAGLGLNLKSRLLGGGLVAVGAITFGVFMLWTILVPVLAAVAVVSWFMAFGPRRAQPTRP